MSARTIDRRLRLFRLPRDPRYLHRFDYVCKRPKWTLKRKAEEQEDWAGNG